VAGTGIDEIPSFSRCPIAHLNTVRRGLGAKIPGVFSANHGKTTFRAVFTLPLNTFGGAICKIVQIGVERRTTRDAGEVWVWANVGNHLIFAIRSAERDERCVLVAGKGWVGG